MTTPVFKPIYLLDAEGELARLPDNAITNIGGVSGPTFTVGGRGLLFEDGTSTNPAPGSGYTLDLAYAGSLNPATINLTADKNLVFKAVNSKQFVFDANTGTVTIEGDLNVLGASNVIEGTISNLDQVNIRPPLPTTVGLTLQPLAGVSPLANLLEVAATAGGPLVFSIGPTGTTTLTDLSITGTINGVDADALVDHINSATTPAKHTAQQVSVDPTNLVNVSGTNVQQVLESIDSKLVALNADNVTGYEYVRPVAGSVWTIAHNSGTTRVQLTVWDEENTYLLPDVIKVVDGNTVEIRFSTPQAGRAILMLF